MSAAERYDPLAGALDELSVLGSSADREAISRLRDRLAGQRLRILVAGEAKRGKSTLVNALVGRLLLPTGVLPLTALATTVRYGSDQAVCAELADGRTETLPLSVLDDLVTERGNPGNCRRLKGVTVVTDAPLLARGVELVDTPGTGSVHGHNALEAEAALATMDAAVFVLTADPPVSASERELIARVAGLSVEMFVVLNKADHLDSAELAEVLAFTRRVVKDAAGQDVRLYPMSARAALSASGDSGFGVFAAAFAGYVERAGTSDLRRSAAGHARRIAMSLRDEVILARRAGEMRGAEDEQRVSAFAERLAAVRDRRQDAADLAAAESKRMLADLNDAAECAGRERTLWVWHQIALLLDGPLRSSAAGEIERAGRERMAELAVAEAEAWRSERARILESGLTRLDERLSEVLRAELDAVRQAASDLLGLELTIAPSGPRLAPGLRFFYQAAEQAGQTELLAGAIRRHLPGESGRRRAREHLRREAGELVPRQIGRARADLQYRLDEAMRRLIRAVDSRYADRAGRLEMALGDAEAQRGAAEGEAVARDRDLAARLARIEHVLTLTGPAVEQASGSSAADMAEAPATA